MWPIRQLIEIGHVEAIFRYPVKSMGGERLELAKLGWHGLDGDRRLAFRRIDDRSGFSSLAFSHSPRIRRIPLLKLRRCVLCQADPWLKSHGRCRPNLSIYKTY